MTPRMESYVTRLSGPRIRRLGRLAAVAIMALGLGALIVTFALGIGALQRASLTGNPEIAATAAALALGYWVLGGVAWWGVLQVLDHRTPTPGGRIRLLDGLRIFFIGNVSRYLPGSLWFAASRVLLARRVGLLGDRVAFSMVLELVLIATAGALIVVATAPSLIGGGTLAAWPAMLAAGVGLLALRALSSGSVLRWTARWRHGASDQPLAFGVTALLVAGYVGVWLVAGASLFFTASLFAPLSWRDLPGVMGAWSIAFLLGLVSPFTPAGIGVRDATATLLLARFMPLSAAAGAALTFRALLTAAEVLCLAPLLPGVAAIMRRI